MDKRLKVLNVLPYGDIGGSQKFVLSLCTYHDKRLFDVAIAVLFSGGAVSDDISRQDFEVSVLGMRNGFDTPRNARPVLEANPFVAADIARVNAKLMSARLSRCDGQLVVEMNVGHNRDAGPRDDVAQRGGSISTGDRHTHNVSTGGCGGHDLGHSSCDIAGVGVGHRLVL